MIALLLGLFRTDRLANDISAVTRVMDILQRKRRNRLRDLWKDKQNANLSRKVSNSLKKEKNPVGENAHHFRKSGS